MADLRSPACIEDLVVYFYVYWAGKSAVDRAGLKMSKESFVSAGGVSELRPDSMDWKEQAQLQKLRATKALQASLRMYELNGKIKSTLDLATGLLDLENEAELFSEAVEILTSDEGMGFRDASLLLLEEDCLHTACSTIERGKKVFSIDGDSRYGRWLAAEEKGEGGSVDGDNELLVTLRSRGQLLGLLEVVQHEREKTFFEGLDSSVEWRRDMLTRIGEVVSMLIDNLRLNRELKRQSTVDVLTGVYTRSFFLQRVEAEVERAVRYDRALSLVFIDVDNFKEVNDEHGHLVGDRVLRELGSLFRRNIRNADVLGRYGGDEFVWLLPETDLEMTVFAACKLIAELRAHRFELPRKEASVETIPVTTSLGGATLLPEEDVESLLRRADEALYKAKAAGRDRLAT